LTTFGTFLHQAFEPIADEIQKVWSLGNPLGTETVDWSELSKVLRRSYTGETSPFNDSRQIMARVFDLPFFMDSWRYLKSDWKATFDFTSTESNGLLALENQDMFYRSYPYDDVAFASPWIYKGVATDYPQLRTFNAPSGPPKVWHPKSANKAKRTGTFISGGTIWIYDGASPIVIDPDTFTPSGPDWIDTTILHDGVFPVNGSAEWFDDRLAEMDLLVEVYRSVSIDNIQAWRGDGQATTTSPFTWAQAVAEKNLPTIISTGSILAEDLYESDPVVPFVNKSRLTQRPEFDLDLLEGSEKILTAVHFDFYVRADKSGAVYDNFGTGLIEDKFTLLGTFGPNPAETQDWTITGVLQAQTSYDVLDSPSQPPDDTRTGFTFNTNAFISQNTLETLV